MKLSQKEQDKMLAQMRIAGIKPTPTEKMWETRMDRAGVTLYVKNGAYIPVSANIFKWSTLDRYGENWLKMAHNEREKAFRDFPNLYIDAVIGWYPNTGEFFIGFLIDESANYFAMSGSATIFMDDVNEFMYQE